MGISVADIHWAAGFIEGEGWFEGNRKVRAAVGQVERQPVEKLQRLFGGTINESRLRTGKILSTWRVNGVRAAQVAMTIYVLMSPKRQREIEKMLRNWRASPYIGRKRIVCRRGHPMAEGNLIHNKTTGGRQCRACSNASHRKNNWLRTHG